MLAFDCLLNYCCVSISIVKLHQNFLWPNSNMRFTLISCSKFKRGKICNPLRFPLIDHGLEKETKYICIAQRTVHAQHTAYVSMFRGLAISERNCLGRKNTYKLWKWLVFVRKQSKLFRWHTFYTSTIAHLLEYNLNNECKWKHRWFYGSSSLLSHIHYNIFIIFGPKTKNVRHTMAHGLRLQ